MRFGGLKRDAQRFTRPEQMRLADHFIERLRAQALGERRVLDQIRHGGRPKSLVYQGFSATNGTKPLVHKALGQVPCGIFICLLVVAKHVGALGRHEPEGVGIHQAVALQLAEGQH